MIKIEIKINSEISDIVIDLPDNPPPIEAIIKAITACQFDSKATDLINEKIKSEYGDEYYNKVINSMSEILNSFREILQNSIAFDPELPAVPVVYVSPRGQK